MNGLVSGRRSQEFDGVVSGDGAGRVVQTIALHQMPGGGPVAVTIEEGADNAAAQHSGKGFQMGFGLPIGDHLIAAREAANMEALFICRPATKTCQRGGVCFLNAFL